MDSLGVLQVAGRVVRHIQLQRSATAGTPFGQELGDIADLLAQLRACVSAQEMAVVLEQRPAPGAVHHNKVAALPQCLEVGFSEHAGSLTISGVLVQGTTAYLAAGLDDP